MEEGSSNGLGRKPILASSISNKGKFIRVLGEETNMQFNRSTVVHESLGVGRRVAKIVFQEKLCTEINRNTHKLKAAFLGKGNPNHS